MIIFPDKFDGPIFQRLNNHKETIIGPTLVRQLAARGLSPQPCDRPLYRLIFYLHTVRRSLWKLRDFSVTIFWRKLRKIRYFIKR